MVRGGAQASAHQGWEAGLEGRLLGARVASTVGGQPSSRLVPSHPCSSQASPFPVPLPAGHHPHLWPPRLVFTVFIRVHAGPQGPAASCALWEATFSHVAVLPSLAWPVLLEGAQDCRSKDRCPTLHPSLSLPELPPLLLTLLLWSFCVCPQPWRVCVLCGSVSVCV